MCSEERTRAMKLLHNTGDVGSNSGYLVSNSGYRVSKIKMAMHRWTAMTPYRE